MPQDNDNKEPFEKEVEHFDEQMKGTNGPSGLPVSNKSFERRLVALSEGQAALAAQMKEVTNNQKKIMSDVSMMCLEISAMLNKAAVPSPSVTPSSSRSNVTPRSSRPYHPNDNRVPSNRVESRPSSSRDRSRSPIAPFNSGSTDVKVPCVFCESINHFSRNCTSVTSLTSRLSILSRRDLCMKCLRPKGLGHPPRCEPDMCRLGCTRPIDGGPTRHMDWVCPRNPKLTP